MSSIKLKPVQHFTGFPDSKKLIYIVRIFNYLANTVIGLWWWLCFVAISLYSSFNDCEKSSKLCKSWRISCSQNGAPYSSYIVISLSNLMSPGKIWFDFQFLYSYCRILLFFPFNLSNITYSLKFWPMWFMNLIVKWSPISNRPSTWGKMSGYL